MSQYESDCSSDYETESEYEYDPKYQDFCVLTEDGFEFSNCYPEDEGRDEEYIPDNTNESIYNIFYDNTKLPKDIINVIVRVGKCANDECFNQGQNKFLRCEGEQAKTELEYYENIIPVEEQIGEFDGYFCNYCEIYLEDILKYYQDIEQQDIENIEEERNQLNEDIDIEDAYYSEERWDGEVDN